MTEAMDQVSRPLLVVLLATVGLAGAWMTVLRPGAPGAGDPPAAAPPPSSAPARVRPAAPARAARLPAGSVTSTGRGRAPATAVRSVPGTILARDLARGRSVVLVFSGAGADDAAARRAALAVAGPGVTVRIVPLSGLGAYESVLAGAPVTETPTTLVIGADRRAQRITGLTDPAQLRAALRDAAR